MSNNHRDVKMRHSSYIPPTNLANYDDNELQDIANNLLKVHSDRGPDHYKFYDHDVVPTREYESRGVSPGSGDNRPAQLTESQLTAIERRVFETLSRQLTTDGVSTEKLNKNIKFFKNTVQDILDNFFKSVKDFEEYKEKLNKFLVKNKEHSAAEMEVFIKDMISHIMSESNVSNDTCKLSDSDTFVDNRGAVSPLRATSASTNSTIEVKPDIPDIRDEIPSSNQSVSIEFKNYNYHADNSTIDSIKKYDRKEEILNIFLMTGGMPRVEIKMRDRNLVSELNFSRLTICHDGQVASAENIQKVSAKKLEIENYSRMQENGDIPDREIPVKISLPKKNIHLNQDFTNAAVEKVSRRSFMTKICNFFCKKLNSRK